MEDHGLLIRAYCNSAPNNVHEGVKNKIQNFFWLILSICDNTREHK